MAAFNELVFSFADVPVFDRLFDARDMVSAGAASCAVPGCPRTCPMLPG